MASSPPSIFLFLVLFISATISTADLCADPRGSGAHDLAIFHVDSPCSPFSPKPAQPGSGFDSVQAQASLDPTRLAYLSSLAVVNPKPTTVPVASGLQIMQTQNYVLRTKLGTPPQLLFLALDTSADTSWVPCTNFTSSTPFSPALSTTYSPVTPTSPLCSQFKAAPTLDSPATCAFNQSYGAGDSFAATVAQDSIRMALDVIQNFTFGCVTAIGGTGASLPKQGLLGLGRGPASFMVQSRERYNGVFSYCLPSFRSYYFSGSLRLGQLGQPKNVRTTPLLSNPHRPSLYYVNLTGVSVGRVLVPAPPGSFGYDPATGAGTVVDAGTVISRFVAYAAVRDEFRRQVNSTAGYSSLGAFDTCFEMGGNAALAPAVTLHFEGMDLVLPAENTLIHSSSTPLACLALAAAPANVDAVVNVIANLQQQNHRVVFDVANSRVGFARELCN